MPHGRIPRGLDQIELEALEAREVPATFGPGTRLSVAYGDIIPVELDGGQAEYITGTGPSFRGTGLGRSASGTACRQPPPLDHTIRRVQGRSFRRYGRRERRRPARLARFHRREDVGPGPGLLSSSTAGRNLLVDFMPFGPTCHRSGPDRLGRRDRRLRGRDHRRPGQRRRDGQGLRLRPVHCRLPRFGRSSPTEAN